MRRADLPSIPQLTIPVAVPITCYDMAYNQGTSSNINKATASLMLIAFFYLLRVGEYTTPHQVWRNKKWV
jgi:hypothetical protein